MKLVDLVRELIELEAPNAKAIRAAIAGRDLTPAVHTINVRDDAMGRGCYAELVVREAARVKELVAVVGDLTPAPRTPGDAMSGSKLAAEVVRGVRVIVELAPRSSDRIAFVTLHYKN